MKFARRTAVHLAAAAIVAARSAQSPASPVRDVLRVLPNRPSAEAIGRAYLDEHGGADLWPEVEAALGLGHATADLRRTVRTRISQDFADGNTVSVEGWVLSRLEAELCALAALEAGGIT